MQHSHYSITAKSLGEAWIASLATVLKYGASIRDSDLTLLEIRNLTVVMESVARLDPIISRYANQERVELMFLKYRSCDIVGDYKISYGKRIYDNMGVNQIDWIVERLRKKPETKSATIGLHLPGDEHLACLSLLDFKLRNSALHMAAVYRSQNVFGSQPGNVLALRDIQQSISDKIGFPAGELSLVVLSAHIYAQDLESAKAVVSEVVDSDRRAANIARSYTMNDSE